MDKDKLIIWLELTCSELEWLSSSCGDDDDMYYTGQLVMVKKLLSLLKKGFFDKEN